MILLLDGSELSICGPLLGAGEVCGNVGLMSGAEWFLPVHCWSLSARNHSEQSPESEMRAAEVA